MTSATPAAKLRIDVWSDVVCPFCWVGKLHLDLALQRQGLDDKVEVVFHAFELNPQAREARPLMDYLHERFGPNAGGMRRRVEEMGAAVGLPMDYDRAVFSSTFDAHRLILLAQSRGRGPEMKERLMRAHFSEGADVSDRATLARLADEVGIPAAEAKAMLAGDALKREVRADEQTAQSIGVRGVPFFVLNQRYAVSGAQPIEAFEQVLRQVLNEQA